MSLTLAPIKSQVKSNAPAKATGLPSWPPISLTPANLFHRLCVLRLWNSVQNSPVALTQVLFKNARPEILDDPRQLDGAGRSRPRQPRH